MSWPLRLVRSLFGLIGLAVTVAGVPWLLWRVLGNPISSWTALSHANGGLWSTLTTPVIDGSSLLALVLVSVGWLLWAYYTLAVLLELVDQVGNLSIRIPGFGLPRAAAGPIVALCLSVVIAAPLVIGAASAAFADPAHDHGSGSGPTITTTTGEGSAARHAGSSVQRDVAGDAASTHPGAASNSSSTKDRAAAGNHGAGRSAGVHDETVTVRRGDSLWQLAETYYGDGMRWHTIAAANADLVGDHGQHLLEPGWELTIPDVVHRDQAQPGNTYEVRQGDNLSKIAETAYGDAHDWRQIYRANHDQISDPDQIAVGQDLQLPTIAGQSTHDGAGHNTGIHAHASDPGDAGGQHSGHRHDTGSVDEDVDRGSSSDRPSTPPTAGDPSAPPSASTQPGSSAHPGQAQQQTSAGRTADTAQEAPDTDDERVSPLVWAAPASALLAAGVLSLVVARRRSHQMRRAAGRRIRPYSDNASAAVTALRHVASDLTVAHLDRATRTLSARLAERGDRLPIVTVARLADDRMDLLLAEPAGDPPAPFTATTPTVWTLRAEDADELLDARDANEIAAPWPALVTLGRDVDGAHLLIDLETAASLAIHAEQPADVPGLLAAMAIELTTSTWADDLTLTLVGCCSDLAEASGVDRVRYVDDVSDLIGQLEREARQSRQLLADEGLPAARQGRLDPETADSWTPHVILIGSPLDDTTADRLRAILTESPRVAVAAVTSGASDQLTEWSLTTPAIEAGAAGQEDTGSVHPDVHGRLTPLGLEISPQYVDPPSYEAILQVLKESRTAADEPAPWWNEHAESADPSRDDDDAAYEDAEDLSISSGDDDEPSTGGDTDHADPAADAADAGEAMAHGEVSTILALPVAGQSETSAGTAGVRPIAEPAAGESLDASGAETLPEPGNQAGADDEQSVDDEQPGVAGEPIPLHRPTVRLLGPVDILNTAGSLTAKRSPTELYEPIAWVLLHPDGLTTQFRDAMRHTSDVNALASRARRYLGLASDGQQLFPSARRTENGRTYRLHDEVESDWHLFCELIDGGANTAPTQNLIQALRLVRGKPLESVTPWAWSDEWVETATAAIVDTAHVLAQRSLAANKIQVARVAVRRGRMVDDLVELLICDEIRIERAAHNFGRVERLCRQLVTNARQQNMELSPDSLALVNDVRTLNRRRAAGNN